MKVNVVYHPDVVDADAHESMATAAARMRENDVSSLAVMQDGDLIGIVSERDVVQTVADGVSPGRAEVGQYMTEHPATANIDEDSAVVARRMIDLGIRHLPVVDHGGVVGVVSARDLLNLEAWKS
jgi:CBS domain-containing protein